MIRLKVDHKRDSQNWTIDRLNRSMLGWKKGESNNWFGWERWATAMVAEKREECLPTRTHEVYILSFCFVFHLFLTLNQSFWYSDMQFFLVQKVSDVHWDIKFARGPLLCFDVLFLLQEIVYFFFFSVLLE